MKNLSMVLDLNTTALTIKGLKGKLETIDADMPVVLSNGTYLTMKFKNNGKTVNSFVLETTENKEVVTVQELIDLLALVPQAPIESFPLYSLVDVNEDVEVGLENGEFISDILELKNHLFLITNNK